MWCWCLHLMRFWGCHPAPDEEGQRSEIVPPDILFDRVQGAQQRKISNPRERAMEQKFTTGKFTGVAYLPSAFNCCLATAGERSTGLMRALFSQKKVMCSKKSSLFTQLLPSWNQL
jgi:hypothetical protein